MRKMLALILGCILSFTVQSLSAQSIITGKVVVEKDGTPISGATISVKNSRLSTASSFDGSFSISAPANGRLVVTYVGYKPTEVAVSSTPLVIQLTESLSPLLEVVVTGYRTSSRRDLVGSASTISAEKIRNTTLGSFDQALQGQVPGILVQAQSGQPGAAASVLIRGKGSILGSNTPLYVLDGIEITAGDFSTLNPSDFQSLSILKDASATSVYGSRGANGVIVITSKKGKSGAPRFNYDVQYGSSTQPENKLKVMKSGEKLDYELANGNPFGWTTSEVDSLRKVETNWEDVFFRTGRTKNHVLSASGGSENTVYYLSGSIFDQTGTVQNTGLKRYTGRANIESKAGDFVFGTNLSLGYSDFKNTSENNTGIATPLNAIRWLNPYETVYDNDGKFSSIVSGQPNAMQELLLNNNLRQQYKGVGNIYINYNAPFLKGLSFRTNWGGDLRVNETTVYTDPTTATGSGATGGRGSFGHGSDRVFRYTGTTSVTYATEFGADHTLSVALFNEIVNSKGRNFAFTGYGLGGAFQNESGITPGNATNGFIPFVRGGGGENALLSYFTDIHYGFKNKYFLNVGARRDGSSKFGANKRYANFGSVGASWIVSDENFMARLKNSFFNELKYKISYGSSGNQAGIGDFQSRELYGRSVYAGVSGLVQTQLANPELQWERKTTFNTGLEISLFNSRLRIVAEYYNSLTSDLFLNKQLSRTTGYASLTSNIGELQNRGVELSLDGDLISTKNFTWKANISFTRNQNKVKKLVGDQTEIIGGITINRIGESINSLYVVRYAGVNPANGNPLYLDLNGTETETYSSGNRVIVGSFESPYFGGFGSSLNYKGFEVSAFFSFLTGNKIFNNDRTNVENPQYLTDNLSVDLSTEWRKAGDITKIPNPTATFRSATTRFVEDGDFLRLRNASVSYSLPQQLFRSIKFSSVRFFAQGQNLFTWTDFRGFDPEISTGSLDGAQYPALRTITFGLNVGL
ncbi:MAG: TonB-dependent receptor [Chitinophagaceae bacterium]